MKKSIALFLSLLMLFSCMAVMSAGAASQVTITLNGETYTANVGDTLTYTVKAKSSADIVNGEFYLHYPSEVLSTDESKVDFPATGKNHVIFGVTDDTAEVEADRNLISFNFSNISSPYSFKDNPVLMTVVFEVKQEGEGTIELDKVAFGSINNELIIVSELDNASETEQKSNNEKAVFTETLSGSTNHPTTISAKLAKTKIYVGQSTTVSATVNYGIKTTYKSSNSAVAKVTVSGSKVIVKGLKAGKAKINVTDNGVTKSLTIEVVKKANPAKISVKTKSVSFSKLKKKAQVASGAVVVKSAQGKVTYTKVTKGSASQLTINKTTGKITVKKGSKKGNYKIKVKVTVAGNTAYNSLTKAVVATVKVK